VLLQYAESPATTPGLAVITAPDASKRYQTDGETLKADIRAVFQLPTLLYGESTAGKLGTSQEFNDATQYVQNMVINTNQRSIERTLTAVFSTFQRPDQPDSPVCPSGNYSIQNLTLYATNGNDDTTQQS
jgi:hypothetical protein